MDAKQKEPYERAAAADASRYRREVLSYSAICYSAIYLTVGSALKIAQHTDKPRNDAPPYIPPSLHFEHPCRRQLRH